MDPIESGRCADRSAQGPLPIGDPYPTPLLSYDNSYGNFHESRLQNIAQHHVGGHPVERYLPPLGFYFDPADDAIVTQLPVSIEERDRPNAHCGRCLKHVREHPLNEDTFQTCTGRCGYCGQMHPMGAPCPQLYATRNWLLANVKGNREGLQIRPSPADEERLKQEGFIHPTAQHRTGLLPKFTAAAWLSRPTSDNRSVRAKAIFNPSDTRSQHNSRPNRNPAKERQKRELDEKLADIIGQATMIRKSAIDAERCLEVLSDTHTQLLDSQTPYMNRQDHMFGSPAPNQQSIFPPYLLYGNAPTDANAWLSPLHESPLQASTLGRSPVEHTTTDDLRAVEEDPNVRGAFRDLNRARSNAQRSSAANVAHQKSVLNRVRRDVSSAAQDRGRRGGSVSRSLGPSSGLPNPYPTTEGLGDARREEDVHDRPFIKAEPID